MGVDAKLLESRTALAPKHGCSAGSFACPVSPPFVPQSGTRQPNRSIVCSGTASHKRTFSAPSPPNLSHGGPMRTSGQRVMSLVPSSNFPGLEQHRCHLGVDGGRRPRVTSVMEMSAMRSCDSGGSDGGMRQSRARHNDHSTSGTLLISQFHPQNPKRYISPDLEPTQILRVSGDDSRSRNNSHRERQGRLEPQEPPQVPKEHAVSSNPPATGVFPLTRENSRETLNPIFFRRWWWE